MNRYKVATGNWQMKFYAEPGNEFTRAGEIMRLWYDMDPPGSTILAEGQVYAMNETENQAPLWRYLSTVHVRINR